MTPTTRKDPMTSRLEDITGYRSGQRVLSASIANARRLGVTLRLGTDLDDRALTEALRSRPNHWAATATNYPTHEVASGPVCENVVKPPEVNLLDFPIPRWHEGDGGRYAGTGCAVFTTDPDTGVVNAGAYRMQVQDDGRAASVNMEAGKHGAAHVRAWFDRAAGHRSRPHSATTRCCWWSLAPKSPAASPSSSTPEPYWVDPSTSSPARSPDCRCRPSARSSSRAG